MHVLVVIKSFDQINLFLNISQYLHKHGCHVDFLTPKLHIRHEIKKQGFFVWSEIPKSKIYDRVLFWNGANTPEKKYFESIPKTVCWYFENGYWPNKTMQLNRKGVNAEADYANLSSDQLLQFAYPEGDLPQMEVDLIENQTVSRVWYFLDKCRLLFTGEFLVLFESLSNIYRGRQARLSFTNANIQIQPSKEFIFFPLQVNSDTQIVYNSPYDSILQVVNLVRKKIPNNQKLVIKTHPNEFENFDISHDGHTEIYQKIDLDKAILDSDFIITINSSVGLQALEKHKKVLHLGDSFYENFPGVIKCNLLKDNFDKKIEELQNIKVDCYKVDKLVYHFRKNIFIEGSWRKPDSNFIHKIAMRIVG